jgi:8-oxo-dGTP pyrophosphatase MutT (NUDIX family)
MANEILCHDKFGNQVPVPVDELKWRVSSCGILQNKAKSILFVRDETTSEWELPGGNVEPGETIEEAVIREFREETTIKIQVHAPMALAEDYYYHTGDKQGYRSLRLAFLVTALEEIIDLPENIRFIKRTELPKNPVKPMSLQLISQLLPESYGGK